MRRGADRLPAAAGISEYEYPWSSMTPNVKARPRYHNFRTQHECGESQLVVSPQKPLRVVRSYLDPAAESAAQLVSSALGIAR